MRKGDREIESHSKKERDRKSKIWIELIKRYRDKVRKRKERK